jgi:hypothetical protein
MAESPQAESTKTVSAVLDELDAPTAAEGPSRRVRLIAHRYISGIRDRAIGCSFFHPTTHGGRFPWSEPLCVLVDN